MCASEVVDLLKCVETNGPAWFYRCRWLHVELQGCYEKHKQHTPMVAQAALKSFRKEAPGQWQNFKWWLEDMSDSLWNGAAGGPIDRNTSDSPTVVDDSRESTS